MKDKNRRFRELLAERGIEMTPEEAKKAYSMAMKIRIAAKRLSTQDLWNMEDNESSGISREERLQIADLYRIAKEV